MRRFTLVEVISVTVIMAMLAAIAVGTLRDPDPRFALDDAVNGFALLCTQTRMHAMETGEACGIRFAGDRRFAAVSGDEELGFEWLAPTKVELDTESIEPGTELFRFFPDGGASGDAELLLDCGGERRRIYVSPLTGDLEAVNAERE